MTRNEEWEIQETATAEMFATHPVSQITGRHKRNTRDRGKYGGYTKSAVLNLVERAQRAEEKKRHFKCSPAERAAMLAYFDERLANLGESVSRGTPDWLRFDSVPLKTTPVDPLIPCGSFECRPEKW
jgi:hypothetical protein